MEIYGNASPPISKAQVWAARTCINPASLHRWGKVQAPLCLAHFLLAGYVPPAQCPGSYKPTPKCTGVSPVKVWKPRCITHLVLISLCTHAYILDAAMQ